MDQIDFDVYFKSADKSKFCNQYCVDYDFSFRTTTASPYIVEYSSPATGQYESDADEGTKKDQLSSSGILHYYRSFIHVFLEKLKHEVRRLW